MADFAESDEDLFADDEAYITALESARQLEARLLECEGKFAKAHQDKDFPFRSVIRSGGMELAFSNPNHHKALIEKADGSLVLFNRKFSAAGAFIENLQDLMMMARKHFVQIEKDALKPRSHLHPRSNAYFTFRQSINLLFEYCSSYIQSLQCEEKHAWVMEEYRSSVEAHLKNWYLLIKGLTEISFIQLSVCPDKNGNQSKLPMHHLLHLHLELRWHYLCLLSALTTQKSTINKPLESALEHFMTELVKLAEGVEEAEYSRSFPFFCNCVRQFWLLLQIFADKMHLNGTISTPFWGVLTNVVNKIFSPPEVVKASIISVSRPVLCKNWTPWRKANFSLWLFLHLAPLYGYSDMGIQAKKLRGPFSDEGSKLLEMLVKRLTTDATEDGMREVLVTLMQLPSWWNVGIPTLNSLLDHYIKNINSQFRVANDNASSLASMALNTTQLSKQIKDHLRYKPETLEFSNSFHLFLKFLAGQMQHAWTPPDTKKLYNQIKGRVCVRFTPGRMTQLGEMGLYNLTSLCLTIGLVMEIDEMGSKLQDFLKSTGSTADFKKKIVIILSHMTLIMLRIEKNLGIETNVKFVLDILNNSCKEINQNNKPLLDFMTSFVDCLSDVVNYTNKSSVSTTAFLGPWLQSYLSVCFKMRAANILGAMMDIASCLPSYDDLLYPGENKEAVTLFMTHLVPYLKQESIQIEPPGPQHIADIAYALTAASEDKIFIDLFKHFGLQENVNTAIVARYLTQVVTSEDVVFRLEQKLPTFKIGIVQAWARCCLFDQSGGANLTQVTNFVASLTDIVKLLGDTSAMKCSSCPLTAFSKLIGTRFRELQGMNNLVQTTQFKNAVYHYFEKLPLAVSHVISRDPISHVSKSQAPSSLIIRMYDVIGNLFVNSAFAMYNKANAKCTLFHLMMTLLLYEDITKYPNFTIDKHIKTALESHFHKFLIGLGNLAQKDATVKRVMIACVTHFVHALRAPKMQDAENFMDNRVVLTARHALHPIERAFVSSNPDLTDMLAQIFGTQTLKMKGQRCDFAHAKEALQLLNDVEIQHGEDEYLITSLVKHTIKDTLLILIEFLPGLDHDESTKETAFRYFKALVNSPPFRDSAAIRDIFNTKMLEIYRDKLKFRAEVLFKMLVTLARFRPQLLTPTFQQLSAEVSQVETLRARGPDANLRSHLKRLESLLAGK